ncbi:MAG: hypothetical protein JO061_17035 [Acidobacteriaceae bacterium]|nr:hypothetical protein [Acidobacteriaceae bacterium]
MPSSITRGLIFGATLFGGLLAGVTANRTLVQLPAWERVGLISWANFTRAENFGLGPIFYPAIGLAALLFTVAAAISARFDRSAGPSRRFPLYSAALLALVWAAITRFVLVPTMSFVSAGKTPAELQQQFITVTRWSGVNDTLHVLTFGLTLWGFAELFSHAQPDNPTLP